MERDHLGWQCYPHVDVSSLSVLMVEDDVIQLLAGCSVACNRHEAAPIHQALEACLPT